MLDTPDISTALKKGCQKNPHLIKGGTRKDMLGGSKTASVPTVGKENRPILTEDISKNLGPDWEAR